jgi:hypothetical protein
MTAGALALIICMFQSRESISVPKTAMTLPVVVSVMGTKPLTHVPHLSVRGPSVVYITEEKVLNSNASGYACPGGEYSAAPGGSESI